MVIFGWKHRTKVIDEGPMSCTHCRQPVTYLTVAKRRWFTLFFIPVIPLGATSHQTICTTCHAVYPGAMRPEPVRA